MTQSRATRPTTLAPEDLPAFRPALLRYASLQVRDTAVAEDLVQNTLVAARQLGQRAAKGEKGTGP